MLNLVEYAEENGMRKGEERGRIEGEKLGASRLGMLIKIFLKGKRYADAEKAAEDAEYREQFYKEYKL